jgi:hypothetical protein
MVKHSQCFKSFVSLAFFVTNWMNESWMKEFSKSNALCIVAVFQANTQVIPMDTFFFLFCIMGKDIFMRDWKDSLQQSASSWNVSTIARIKNWWFARKCVQAASPPKMLLWPRRVYYIYSCGELRRTDLWLKTNCVMPHPSFYPFPSHTRIDFDLS